jgi:hypothetical protein
MRDRVMGRRVLTNKRSDGMKQVIEYKSLGAGGADVSLDELESKVAAFFELLDEWDRSEEAEFFRLCWMPRLLNSQGYPAFLFRRAECLGGLWGGGRRDYLLFT